MKGKLTKGTIGTLVFLLLISAAGTLAIMPAHAAPTTIEVINPLNGSHDFNFSSDTTSVGSQFVVNVTVKDVMDLQNWQISLAWNDTLLDFVEITLPSDHVFVGASRAMIQGPPINNPGNVIWGCTYINTAPFKYWTFNGTGTLCQIKLQIKQGGVPQVSSALAIAGLGSDTFLIDGQSHDIQFTPVFGNYVYRTPQGAVPVRNVAIAKLDPMNTVVAPGFMFNVTVTAENRGNFTETFNVSVYVNSSPVGPAQTVENLASGQKAELLFIWYTQGYAIGNYTLSAVADVVPDDIDPSDNTATDTIHVIFAGDVNGDGTVDMRDVQILLFAWNAHSGDPRWNPYADMNADNRVDLRDLGLTLVNFLKKAP